MITISEEEFKKMQEDAEKYRKIESSWKNNQHNDTLFFIRDCKQIIENFEIPKRKSMI